MRQQGFIFLQLMIVLAVIFFAILIFSSFYDVNAGKSGGIRAKFIDNKLVFLDKRIHNTQGSWNSEYQLHDPITVKLVYNELKKRLARKEDVILIDIGANTGSFSLLPVVSRKIKVFAFEPNLAVADILRSNVQLNNIQENVVILPIGVSNKYSLLQLNVPDNNESGLATYGENVLRFDPKNKSTVTSLVNTLDNLTKVILKPGEQIDVIKIDTEGWEYYILQGARQTLLTHKPAILLEFNHINMKQAGVEPEQINTLLHGLNYKCETYGEDLFCTTTRGT